MRDLSARATLVLFLGLLVAMMVMLWAQESRATAARIADYNGATGELRGYNLAAMWREADGPWLVVEG